jgi:hypothetical protein
MTHPEVFNTTVEPIAPTEDFDAAILTIFARALIGTEFGFGLLCVPVPAAVVSHPIRKYPSVGTTFLCGG